MLSEWLCEKNTDHELCIATEYGEQVLTDHPCAHVNRGRMDAGQIAAFMKEQGTEVVADATHPCAKVVTDNIRQAAETAGVRYLRLDRDKIQGGTAAGGPVQAAGDAGAKNIPETPAEKHYFEDTAACVKALANTSGNILLTTGSKELSAYMADTKVRDRVIGRVLPGKESIEICENCGLPGKRIIAMQGPFSLEMNLALIHSYDIKIMVSKLSGSTGGFFEKEAAAAKAGIPLYIIGRPQNSEGMSFEEICGELYGYLNEPKRKISLIGCGMGHLWSLTGEAREALEKADLVFGAKRLLADLKVEKESWPYYLAKDIIPVLKEKKGDAAVLFSGDSGFYSGAAKMHLAIKEAIEEGMPAELRIYPGISSVSNLAALFGVSWEDARIFSTHGKGTYEDWGGKLLWTIKTNKKTFLLLSGVKDLNTIGNMLKENGLDSCLVLAGYQMSYPEQELLYLDADKCVERTEEGLYALFIINENAGAPSVSCGLPDEAFIRAKVPMTKEEVREASISKLFLKSDSVVYDIGSGTGSIAVEIAALSPDITVYAIERKPEAVELIKQNAAKFGLTNIKVVEGYAPEALKDLPAPTHVFIGGSGGNMNEIVATLFEKNPCIRVCANAVSLETLEELKALETAFEVEDFRLVQLAAVRTGKVGSYTMMKAENPVWICTFSGKTADR